MPPFHILYTEETICQEIFAVGLTQDDFKNQMNWKISLAKKMGGKKTGNYIEDSSF